MYRPRRGGEGLLRTAILEARCRDIKVVVLHASDAGRPIYERNGLKESNEMILDLDAEAND
jgi:hypothetical protein